MSPVQVVLVPKTLSPAIQETNIEAFTLDGWWFRAALIETLYTDLLVSAWPHSNHLLIHVWDFFFFLHTLNIPLNIISSVVHNTLFAAHEDRLYEDFIRSNISVLYFLPTY